MTEPVPDGTPPRFPGVPPTSASMTNAVPPLRATQLGVPRPAPRQPIAWIAGFAAAAVVLGVVWCIDQVSASRYRAWSYADTLQKLAAAANATELAVHRRTEFATELKTLLSLPTPLPTDKLSDRTQRALHEIEGMLAAFWIRDANVIDLSSFGNPSDEPNWQLLADERDRQVVKTAVAEGTSWFGGPFTLENGRQGLVYLEPVVSASASSESTSSSLIAIVIDYETIWSEVQAGPASDLQIGLRQPPTHLAEPPLLRAEWTDVSRPARAAFVDIAIPSGGWQLYGLPKLGWPDMAPDAISLRIGGSLFAALAGVLVYMVVVAHIRQLACATQLMAAHHDTQLANRNLETQIHQTLRSEERLRTIVEANPFGMLCATRDGIIVLANRRMGRMFGYEPEELIGKSVELFLPPELHAQHIQDRLEYSRQPRTYELGKGRDLFGLHKAGHKIPLEVALTPVISEQGTQILAVVNDITIRKQVADDLKRTNEQLKRSNRDLEEFAYAASHDLQEPLRKIEAFCSLLDQEYSHIVHGDGKTYLEYVINGAARMRRLIQDLLEYSRIKTLPGQLNEVDANQALEEALQNLSASLEDARGVVTHDSLPTVRADHRQLTQLLQNLIGNGIKYRSDQPPRIHVSSVTNEEEWIFAVKDNGIGINAQFHERIFGIFKRLHSPDEYSGTGIGLAICKRIVERLQGRIWVESEEGAGSAFYFSVPKLSL